MKKVIWILLALILVLGLYNCSGQTGVGFTKNKTDQAADAVKEELRVYICVVYDVLEMPVITTNVQSLSEYQYEITGEIGFMEADGTACATTYRATAVYNPDTEGFHVEFELGTVHRSP